MNKWHEQQLAEFKLRTSWLQELADSGMTCAQAADYCEMPRGQLLKLTDRHGVTFQRKWSRDLPPNLKERG